MLLLNLAMYATLAVLAVTSVRAIAEGIDGLRR